MNKDEMEKLNKLYTMSSYDYWLREQSDKQIEEHPEKCFGRGLTNPYQFFIDDNGNIIENHFGEIRVLGKVNNPEMLQEVKKDCKPAFSIRSLGPIQDKEKSKSSIPTINVGELIKAVMPDAYNSLYEYQKINLSLLSYTPSRQCGKTPWLLRLMQSIEDDYNERIKHESVLLKLDNTNKNGRIYSQHYLYDKCFDPYERGTPSLFIRKSSFIKSDRYSFGIGDQVLLNKKRPMSLDQYFIETKYGNIATVTQVPKINLNIKLKRNPYKK